LTSLFARGARKRRLSGYAISSFAVIGPDIFPGTDDGVFLSANSGASRRAVSSGLPEKTAVTALAVDGPYLFAGTYLGGIWRLPLSELPGPARQPGPPKGH
jgi:hypothetical protein